VAKAAPPRGGEPTGISFGPFRLYAAQQQLLEGDVPVALGSRAFDILAGAVASDAALGECDVLDAFQLPSIEECFARVQQALASIGPGPQRDARTRQAMQLLAALGLSRALATGFAPDAIEAFTRAFGIAESVGDTENQLGMLYGLWTCRFATGAFRTALALGRRFTELAASVGDSADLLIGDRLVGIALHYLGSCACRVSCACGCARPTQKRSCWSRSKRRAIRARSRC